MVKHSLICFYFCWASSLLSPSTAFQASHLAPPLVFKIIKTLMRSPKVDEVLDDLANQNHWKWNSLQVQHSWLFNVHIAHSCLKDHFNICLFSFSWPKHPKSFHLLVKPVNLFQLLISESFVDFFAHGVRRLVKLLLESHDDQLQTLDTVGQGVGGLKGIKTLFF